MCNIEKERCRTCSQSSVLALPENMTWQAVKQVTWRTHGTLLCTCCAKHSDPWILSMLDGKCHSFKTDDCCHQAIVVKDAACTPSATAVHIQNFDLIWKEFGVLRAGVQDNLLKDFWWKLLHLDQLKPKGSLSKSLDSHISTVGPIWEFCRGWFAGKYLSIFLNYLKEMHK